MGQRVQLSVEMGNSSYLGDVLPIASRVQYYHRVGSTALHCDKSGVVRKLNGSIVVPVFLRCDRMKGRRRRVPNIRTKRCPIPTMSSPFPSRFGIE
jgi:hypothetical protein